MEPEVTVAVRVSRSPVVLLDKPPGHGRYSPGCRRSSRVDNRWPSGRRGLANGGGRVVGAYTAHVTGETRSDLGRWLSFSEDDFTECQKTTAPLRGIAAIGGH